MTDKSYDDPIVQKVFEWYRSSESHSSEWRQRAKENYDFVAGTQWDEEDLSVLKDQNRPAVTFNRTQRTLAAVVGSQVQNRQETTFKPRTLEDGGITDAFTSAGEWVRDECDAEYEESDAFNDLCITGMGWVETRVDYDEEPDGKIIEERVDPLEMYWDSTARKKNITDTVYRMRIRKVPLMEFQNNWPDADIDAAQDPWPSIDDDVSQRTHVYPQDAYNRSQKSARQDIPSVMVAQCQWYEYRDIYRVGPEAVRMEADKFNETFGSLEEAQMVTRVLKQRAKVFKQAFVAGGVLLEESEPYPEGFTLTPMTGIRDRNKGYWYGLVELMKDPQRFNNKFFSLILDILSKGSKGGLIIEEGVADDIQELERRWASTGGVVKVRQGAVQNGRIQEKSTINIPPSLDRLMMYAQESIHDVTGVNLELLGFANREQPGILEQQRKQAGMTILSTWFDAFRLFRKEQGRVMLYMIRHYIPEGTLIRVLGESGSQYVPLMKPNETVRFDVIVDESPQSPNQQERTYLMMAEILPNLVNYGFAPPIETVDYTPMPTKLREAFKRKAMEGPQIPPEIQEQLEQQQQELQKLGEENQALKDKRAEMEMNAQIKMADLELKKEENALTIQFKREEAAADIRAEQEKATAQMALEREKASANIELEKIKLAADIELKQMELQQDMQIEHEKALAQVEIEKQKVRDKENERNLTVESLVNKVKAKPRQIIVKRDANDMIESLMVNELLEEV